MHKFNPANLERLIGSERAVWFPPEPVLASMSCRTGLTVLDFGAGPGYHSLRLSEQVGPTGWSSPRMSNPPCSLDCAKAPRNTGGRT